MAPCPSSYMQPPCNIQAALNTILPDTASLQFGIESARLDPRQWLLNDIRARFVLENQYANCLKRFASLVDSALDDAPPIGFSVSHVSPAAGSNDGLKRVTVRVANLERLLALAPVVRQQFVRLVGLVGVSLDARRSLERRVKERGRPPR